VQQTPVQPWYRRPQIQTCHPDPEEPCELDMGHGHGGYDMLQ